MSTPLEQIKEARTQAKATIELAEHLEKLRKNRSFNAVFTEFVFKELPVRSANVFGRTELTESAQKNINNTLVMISTLNHTLSNIYTQADHARQTLVEIDEAEAEYLAEVGE
jgi:hypothetical protein